MDHQSVHSILRRNTMWSLLRHGVMFAIVFVLTPIVIQAVGDAQYGLWLLIFSIIGYTGLLDVGVQQATVKLVAQCKGLEDVRQVNSIASSALVFFVFIGFVGALVFWLVLPHYIHVFVDDPEILPIANRLLKVLGINVILVLVQNVLVGIALGLHQQHFKSILDIVLGIARLGLTILVLEMGYGLLGLAWVKLGLDSVFTVMMLIVCRYSFKDLHLSPWLMTPAAFKTLFSVGSKIFIATGMLKLHKNTTPVAISILLSIAWTAYYGVAKRFSEYVNEVVWALGASFLPMFSELTARGQDKAVRDIYIQYTRYIMIFSMPLYISLMILGPAFLELWVGPAYAKYAGPVLVLLALNALLLGQQPLLARLMVGGGNINFYVRTRSIFAGASIAGGVVLIPWLSIIGPPIAELCATMLLQLVFFIHLDRHMKIYWRKFLMSCHVCLMIPISIFAISLVMFQYIWIPNNYFSLILSVFISGIIYAVSVWVFSLQKHEMKCFFNRLSLNTKKMLFKKDFNLSPRR